MITELVIPDNVTYMEANAFDNCNELESVILGRGVTSIDSSFFFSHPKMSKVTLLGLNDFPSSFEEYIEDPMFGGYSEEIGYFQDNDIIEEVILNGNISRMDGPIFKGCTKLKKIKMPDSLQTLSGSVFYNCPSLETVTFSDKLQALESYEYYRDYLSGDYEYFSIGCFENCTSLSNIHLGNNLKKIGDRMFAGCTSLEEIVLPESLTSVGAGLFYYCSSLKKIVLPSCMTRINTSVVCFGIRGIQENYQYLGFFDNCSSLSEIVFNSDIVSIEAFSFINCRSLKTIDIPDSVEEIETMAFKNCISLTNLKLPANLKLLSSPVYLQQDCTGNGNDGDIYYTEGTFAGCTSLECIELNDALTYIGENAFQNCEALQTVSFPDNLAELAPFAFYGCKNLKHISFGNGLHRITFGSFQNCASLSDIVWSDEIYEIGQYAFAGCDSLVNFELGYNIETIEDYAFSGCSNLKNLVCYELLNNIGNYIWQGCDALQRVYFCGPAPYINSQTFNDVKVTAYYPENVRSWKDSVFQNYGGEVDWQPWDAFTDFIDLEACTIIFDSDKYEYTGEAVEPEIQVIYLDEVLESDEFIVEYRNNIEPGKAEVQVYSIGPHLLNSLSASFEICAPAKPILSMNDDLSVLTISMNHIENIIECGVLYSDYSETLDMETPGRTRLIYDVPDETTAAFTLSDLPDGYYVAYVIISSDDMEEVRYSEIMHI